MVERALDTGDSDNDNVIECGSHNTYQWFGQSDYVDGDLNFNKFCLWDLLIEDNCKIDKLHTHYKDGKRDGSNDLRFLNYN